MTTLTKEEKEEMKVGIDTTNRRRRQRHRRQARRVRNGRSAAPVRIPTRASRFNRRSMEHENDALHDIEELPASIFEEVTIKDTLSDELIHFCEAVVHPFGGMAIGATLPDRYQELIIPMTDRLEIDLTPDLFNLTGDWQTDDNVQLTGIFVWFQPRCLAAGGQDVFTESSASWARNPFIGVDDTISTLDQSVHMNQYNLCFTGIWDTVNESNNAPVTYGFYNENIESGPIASWYAAIQYTRFDNILANTDKMRILGSGIKMWSEEAPINTGGYSVGGWITFDDIVDALEWGPSSDTPTGIPGPVRPGALKAIQPSIKFAKRTPGVKGSTVRYSCLQVPEQIESEYPKLPDRAYVLEAGGTNGAQPQRVVGTASAVNDVIVPGTYVPCIFWQFNTNDDGTSVYTIKLMSMVHSEGTPTGSSPFMSTHSACDNMANHVKTMLEDVETFPVAASGHSFKSFLKKAGRVTSKVIKGAGSIAKIIALVDKFAK
jgi:hypothetical protein